MKTAMQELIENLESNIKGCEIALIDTIEKEFVKGIKRALEDVKIDLENALIKEKEQIIRDYNEGYYNGQLIFTADEPMPAYIYYNETYNQNK
jgi:hypothetical protein